MSVIFSACFRPDLGIEGECVNCNYFSKCTLNCKVEVSQVTQRKSIKKQVLKSAKARTGKKRKKEKK